jgi:alpha-L-rhamnosidase
MSHPFQGGFVAWFFEGLAGITPDPANPGFRLFHLEPQMMDGLNWVDCRFDSPMGMIESSWKRSGNKLSWTVEIPAGSKAILRIPGRLIKIEGGSKEEISLIKQGYDLQMVAQILTLASGKYRVTSKL